MFPGAVQVDTATLEGRQVLSRALHQVNELHFRRAALSIYDQGWNVIPQDRDSRRTVSGKHSGLTWKEWKVQRPARAVIEQLSLTAMTANAAVILGRTSGNTFAIDLDLSTAWVATRVKMMAVEHLGYSKWKREGQAPKMVLLYRLENAEDLPKTRQLKFEQEDGNALDILGDGALVTVSGIHRKTGSYFTWLGPAPDSAPPAAVPVVTPEQIKAFLDAVHREFPLAGYERKVVSHVTAQVVEIGTGGFRNPAFLDSRVGDWKQVDGRKVIHGHRGSWLWSRAGLWVSGNADIIDQGGEDKVRNAFIREAQRHIQRSGEWAISDDLIETKAVDAFDRTLANWRSGDFRGRKVAIGEDGKATFAEDGVLAIDGQLGTDADWLKPARKRRRSPSTIIASAADDHKPNPEIAKQLALLTPEQRAVVAERVAREVREPMAGWLEALWDCRDAGAVQDFRGTIVTVKQKDENGEVTEIQREITLEEAVIKAHNVWVRFLAGDHPAAVALRAVVVVMAPTGAGKTTTFYSLLDDIVARRGQLGRPVPLFQPSHANLVEVKDRATGKGAADLAKAKEEALIDGRIDEERLAEVMEATGGRLRVLQYKGKLLNACFYADRMKVLIEGGVSASGLCRRSSKDKDGKVTEDLCPMAAECAWMHQVRLAPDADLILLPHAYLTPTAPLPKIVRESLAGVVVDERFWTEMIKVGQFPLSILARDRKEPTPDREERKKGITGQDLLQDRAKAAEIFTQAVMARKCPWEALFRYSRTSLKRPTVTGLDLVVSAKTVCTRAQRSSLSVEPGMSVARAQEIAAEPHGEHLELERRLWIIGEERINALKEDEAGTSRLAREMGAPYEKQAKGETDRRVKVLRREEPQIQLSWRVDRFAYKSLPTLLLDASASERITRKIYGGREVRMVRIDAPLHLRTLLIPETFSDMSLLPNAEGNKKPEDRIRAAERQAKVKHVISRLSGLYPDQRILVGSNMSVETEVNANWAHPRNVDWVHNGALRGLNWAENHAVVLGLGRLEAPVDVLDGYSAALCYDDDEQEPDWDVEGNGWDKARNQPIRAPQDERRVKRRDGANMTVKTAGFTDAYPWHREVQQQFREEEIRQLAGRVRPVYRTDVIAPLFVLMATCVPDGIVVDEVIQLDDLLGREDGTDKLYDAIRRNQGILDPDAGDVLAPDVLGGSTGQRLAIEKLNLRELGRFGTVNIWTDGATAPRQVRYLSYVDDLWTALYDAQRRIGRELDHYEVVECPPPVNGLARAKPVGKVDRVLSFLPYEATMDELLRERMDREEADRENQLGWAKHEAKGPIKAMTVPAWAGVPQLVPLDVRVILARCSPGEGYKPPPGSYLAEAA